jgi:hypothetical protein
MKNTAESPCYHSCVKGLGALLSTSLQTSGFRRKGNLRLNDCVAKTPLEHNFLQPVSDTPTGCKP